MYTKLDLQAFYSHIEMTSCQMTSHLGPFDDVRSRDISCHVTATSCDLQSGRISNVHKTRLIGLLQPLPGDFRSNDVLSRSLSVT